MGTRELFEAFDSRVRVTTSAPEWETAVQRLLDCAAALKNHYYASAETDNHLTAIGSLMKGTTISPIADADGVFRMPAGTYNRFQTYAGNGQSALLQEVRGVLGNRYPSTRIRGDGPVVVVAFLSGPSVEIVPGVLCDEPIDNTHVKCEVPVTRNGGSWDYSDYGAEYDNSCSMNAVTAGQYSRLIRYMKVWRRVHEVTFKSVGLELMAAEFMSSWDLTHTSQVFDDWLVRDFLAHMVTHFNSTYSLPSGKHIETGGLGWLRQARQSWLEAQTACHRLDTSWEYVWYWKRILGDDFGA